MRLALALLLAWPAAAADPLAAPADQDDPEVARVRVALAQDPAFQDAAARRIARSRLGGLLSRATTPAARRAAVKDWIARDPDSAARLALGLARDDRDVGSAFEDGVVDQARTYYGDNTGAQANVFHRLRRAIAAAKLPRPQDDAASDEEAREKLRSLFEGRGAPARIKAPRSGPVAAPDGYDRLSALNPRGYSPQVLALQSELNARGRPIGAPKLAETGRLDYETLFHPAYGMRRDIDVLAARASARGAPALERARAALSAFEAAANQARRPDAITRDLLLELSPRQKDAARWIAAAALEDEIAEIEKREGFLTPQLIAAVDAVLVPAAERERYKKAGEGLRRRIAQAKGTARRALSLLEGSDWVRTLAEADALAAESRRLCRTLFRDIAEYSSVPSRAAGSGTDAAAALAAFHRIAR